MQLNKIKRKMLKKKIDKENLLLIKNSGYFDENYYLNNNKDVKDAGVNPLKHYYYNGWKEGRNPSRNFDMLKYSKLFGNVKENPIIHYLNNKEKYVDFIVPSIEYNTVNEMIKKYFNEKSMKIKVTKESKKKRLNIIFEEFNRNIFFGGRLVPLFLVIMFCNEYDYNLRIISPDVEESVFYEIINFYNLKFKQNVEFFSINFDMYLDVNKKDEFVCTSWENVDKILNIPTIEGKIFYLVQDAEFNYYGVGDTFLRSLNILNNERTIPIVDSEILYEYLLKKELENIKNNGIYFNPVIPKRLLKQNNISFKKKTKYNLLYYATPSTKQNLFYFSIEVLDKAIKKDILKSEEWNIYVLGDINNQIIFENNISVKMIKDISPTEYFDLLSNIDLFFCPTYAFRPDYEILNATLSGAVCLTNINDNKKDLSCYSNNIVMTNLNLKDMLEGLEKAVKLSFNSILREENYQKSINKKMWNASFKEVLDFMNKHIGE